MKKSLVILGLACLPLFSFSQVFNTASILKPGSFSFSVEPVIIQDNLGAFFQAGVGLTRGVDLALKAGFLQHEAAPAPIIAPTPTPYIGMDLEWKLKGARPSISITTGAHRNEFGAFGLDGSFNLSFAIGKRVFPYTGFDSDLNFDHHDYYYGHYHEDATLLMWIPVGVEIYLRKSISFIVEAEIPLQDNAYYVMGAGFTFYFK
jgi:hypothetical protein